MNARLSDPFRPGAGTFPPELAGRAVLVVNFTVLANRAVIDGEYQRPILVVGRRGMGKTVLLTEFVELAKGLKAVVAEIEVKKNQSLKLALVKALHRALRQYAGIGGQMKEGWRRALSVFKSLQMTVDPGGSYTFGIDVDPAAGFADTGDLTEDLIEMFQAVGLAARGQGSAVMFFVDELQLADPDEIDALNVALHKTGQGKFPVPVVFVGAGLPSLMPVVAASTAYAERLYEPILLKPLGDADAAAALTIPTEKLGVTWDEDALTTVVQASRGYPFLIQQYGSAIWRVRVSDHISADDVEAGITDAIDKLDESIYSSRWARATPAEKKFLTAMADDDEQPSAIGDIATRVGVADVRGVSRARTSLMSKTLIFTQERGFVEYTIPGMADYIKFRLLDE